MLHSHQQDIEYCGTGWQSAVDGTAQCESGHCCSIHGRCGLEEYHCEFGLSPEWLLFVGIMLMSVTGFIYTIGANKRIIALMVKYKRSGERVDALIVPNNAQKSSSWTMFRRKLEEGTRHCRWNQITLEYNVKTTTTKQPKDNNNNKATPTTSQRVRKVVSVSKHVLNNNLFKTKSMEGTIRVLVLPNHPMSAFARDEVDWTILKQQKQIYATYGFILLFTGLYIYLSLLLLSLIGGQRNKELAWKYFWSNFLWSPPLPYILAKCRERREHKIWLTDGEFVTDSDAAPLLGA